MKLHGNARTCPRSRKLLVQRIEAGGWPRAQATAAAGVSERTAAKWLARWRAEGEAGLADRSSAPHRIPHRTPERRRRLVLALRGLRLTAAEIARSLAMPLSTVCALLKRAGLGRLSRLAPRSLLTLRAPPPRRAAPHRRQEARPDRSPRPSPHRSKQPAGLAAARLPARLRVRARLRR
jgi:transposase